MLRTGKQVWEATAKRTALDLRLQELEFHVQRFTTVTTQASLLAGFAFEGLVHMDVPEDADPNLEYAFWITGSLAMMFALYVLVVGSMVSILGHQLALLGASGDSLEDAVRILRNRRFSVFGSAGMALLMMVASAACMGLMKFGAAGEISSCRACSHTGSAPLARLSMPHYYIAWAAVAQAISPGRSLEPRGLPYPERPLTNG